MVNKHGMKMIGLRKVSGATYDVGPYSARYWEVFYNTKSGEVWCKEQYSFGHATQTIYDNPSILHMGNYCHHLTMQELADIIEVKSNFLRGYFKSL